MKEYGIKFIKGIIIVLLLNVLYFLFMVMAFHIPKDMMSTNMGLALEVWQHEIDQVEPLFYDDGFYIDSFSDMIWANIASQDTDNPVKTVVSMDYTYVEGCGSYDNLIAALYYEDAGTQSYSRYWNLVAGFMRIFFCFFKLRDLRYLFYFITTTLMILVLMRLSKKKGFAGWFPAFIAFTFTVINLHAICFSFCGEILIMFIGMLFVLYLGNQKFYKKNYELLFLLIGSFNFAIGPFVSPTLALGMVLLAHLLYATEALSRRECWKQIVSCSVFWVLGYGGTMLIKQFMAYVMLGSQTGTESVRIWFGPEFGIWGRLNILWNNVLRLFSPQPIKVPIFIILVLALVWLLKCHWSKEHGKKVAPILFVSAYPIFWILIIARHSQHWFASNALSVCIFGMLSLALSYVDFNRINIKKKEG